MKKTRIAGLFVILFVALPTFATSGACSYHGGVNCSVVSSGGDAVCKDGTISSVSYNSMVECGYAACVAPVALGCSTQNDYDELNSQVAAATHTAVLNSRYAPGNMSIVAAYQQKLDTCQEQVDQYSKDLKDYSICIHTKACGYIDNGTLSWSEERGCKASCDEGYYAAQGKCFQNVAPKQDEPAAEPGPAVAPTPAPIVATPAISVPSVPIGKPIVPKAAPKPKPVVEATTTATTTVAPLPMEVPIAPPSPHHGFFYWINPVHWF